MTLIGALTGLELLSAKEIGRIDYRTMLFRQHAWDDERARSWALRLTLRDRADDKRRLCVECAHLTTKWGCREGESVVAEVLQHCPKFTWQKP